MLDARRYLKIIKQNKIFINRPIEVTIDLIGFLYSNEYKNSNSNGHNGRKKIIEIIHSKYGINISINEIKKLYRFERNLLNKGNIYFKLSFRTDLVIMTIIDLINEKTELRNYLLELCNTTNVLNENILIRQILLGEYYNQLIAHKTSGCFVNDKKALDICNKLDNIVERI